MLWHLGHDASHVLLAVGGGFLPRHMHRVHHQPTSSRSDSAVSALDVASLAACIDGIHQTVAWKSYIE